MKLKMVGEVLLVGCLMKSDTGMCLFIIENEKEITREERE